MARLEELTPAALVKGIIPDAMVEIVSAKWHGDVLEIVYKDSAGRVGMELLYRDKEASLQIVTAGRHYSFDGDGKMFRLVSEAHRIRLAYLFDPHVAVDTSLVQPLPHQITAVYEAMLPRQPLRYVLADDPGAGKTIMAGLLIKELLIRGDLQRCLIVAPGNLVEQWQDEMWRKFNLPFEIATNDQLEAARTGNWFREHNLCISRLDKLSRDPELQAKLLDTDWDLIVCDEAHIPLWRGDHVTIKQLTEDFARYLYLPRLRDAGIIIEAIREGLALLSWQQDSFGYADDYDTAGKRYRGLRCGQHVVVTEDRQTALLVKPDVAIKQIESEKAEKPPVPGEPPKPQPGQPETVTKGKDVKPPEPAKPKRFYGSVELNSLRVGKEAGKIAEEIIQHLTVLPGANITVTLEIHGEIPAGAPDATVRTVNENARTLKFTSHSFEQE